MDFKQILELNELSKAEIGRYPKKRILYDTLLEEKGRHFMGIVGPRGVGKTILIKQIGSQLPNSFYISLDSIPEIDLFEVAKTLVERYKVEYLLLDEIHQQKNYAQHLKKIYDFLNIRVIFSSSVSLSIISTSQDLSRRARLKTLYPFSFREYLFFKKNIQLPLLSVKQIFERQWSHDHLKFEYMFEDYIQGGLFPFAMDEPDILPLLQNILQKIIQKDIPAFSSLKTDEINILEKMIAFIGKSSIDGINYSSLSQNLGITKYKAESYLKLFEKTFTLQSVFPTGSNVLREPKIVMSLPYRLLYKDFPEATGGLREDFTVQMLNMAQIPVHYLKARRGEKTPDYLMQSQDEEYVLEVGGKSKGREQFKGIEIKNKMILCQPFSDQGSRRPLFLLGFLS